MMGKTSLIPLPNSFCGYTLQTGCMLIGAFQTVIAIPLLCLSIEKMISADRNDVLIITGAFLVIQVMQIIFAACLFEGSKERHLKSCKIWLVMTPILTVLMFVFLIYEIYDDPLIKFYQSAILLLLVANIISNLVFIWIASGFLQMLREEEAEGGTVYNT